jgi:arginine N-succinyltransferase
MLVRPARESDLATLVMLAQKTGGGFTNLPPEPEALEKRLHWSLECLAKEVSMPNGEFYMLVLEQEGQVTGTASLFSKLGTEWPFYSYHVTKLSQTSRDLNKSLSFDVLTPANEFDGFSEVGGLFLDPAFRRGGAGRLLARSRYLFIAQSRARFAEKVVADLRGFQAEDSSWPFWEAIGRYFFEMEFEEADRHNSLAGNQFIADLMPRYPIYAKLLPEAARAAIGKPHKDGMPAYRLLVEEGFRNQGYIDIFDGGPSMSAVIDDLNAVRNSVVSQAKVVDNNGEKYMIAAGSAADFRATIGSVTPCESGAEIATDVVQTLNLSNGEMIRYVAF